ncbi:MAG: MoaD/ThiS family protein [Alkalispirochaeta sp.]
MDRSAERDSSAVTGGAPGAHGAHGSSREVPVRLFGPLSDLAAAPVAVTIALPMQVADLRVAILDIYPGFGTVRFKIAVDGRIRDDSEFLEKISEIALLPPFAGG